MPNDHLQARGTYYVNVEKIGHGAHWRRTYGQQVYSPFLLAFTHEVYLLAFSKKSLVFCVFIIFQSEHFLQEETEWKSYSVPKASMMDANYSLPDNVAIVTLQVSLYSPSSTLYPAWHYRIYIHSLTEHVLTFQNLDDGTTLLRLAHLFQVY